MAQASFTQSSFLGGEISPLAQGRIDDPRYRTGMNVCLNSLPIETGAWTRRSGTRQVAVTLGGAPARAIKFDFEESAAVNMIFTDNALRFVAGTRLSTTNDPQAITAISRDSPAIVTTEADHGWSTGDQVFIGDLTDPLLLNRSITITVADTDKFTITDAVTGEPINGAKLAAFTSGTATRAQKLTTTYSPGQWQQVRSIQAETSATLLHPNARPYIVTVTTAPVSGLVDAQFSVDPLKFVDGPYLDPVAGGVEVTPDSLKGIVTLSLEFPAWDSAKAYNVGDYAANGGANYQSLVDLNVNKTPSTHPGHWEVVSPAIAVGPNGFTGADVGRHIRLFSEPNDWASGGSYSAKAVVKFAGSYWISLIDTNVSQPGTNVDKWAIDPTGSIWTWGKITALGNIIDRALAGSTSIGSAPVGGGLAAAFDGVTSQNASSGCLFTQAQHFDPFGGDATISNYVGKDYGASPQMIDSATIYSSADNGLCYSDNAAVDVTTIILNLRASNTLPASSSDGTLLGTKTVLQSRRSAISINSSDKTTAYEYVWIETVVTYTPPFSGGNAQLSTAVAEVQFYSPTGGSSTSLSVQILGDDLLYTVPIRTWRLGAYSDSLGWPSCGTYHEGRLWLSGAIGNRIDGSVPGDVNTGTVSFAPTESDGTVTDASAINYTFDAPDVNPIYWMEPDLQGIICGTKAGEWLVQASALNNPLTPLNIQAHRVTKIGCANIEPRRTEHTLVFVQKFGRKVMEYFADVFSGKFTAPNLHEKAKHLTLTGIEEIAYQQELVPVIWGRCGDGSLIGGTYKRDTLMTSQGPTFMGWHPHTHGAARKIESMCVGPNDDGTLDALTLVTYDAGTGLRYIEIMTNLPDESTTLQNSWFVDAGIVPVTSVVTVHGTPHLRLAGLWPHNGKTVAVWAGGLDLGDYLVADGYVDVPFAADDEHLFTQTYFTSYSGTVPVIAGFAYRSDGQIVRPATQIESGARTGPALGKKRRATHYAMLLQQTKGLYVGTSFDAGKMNKANFTTSPDGGAALTALQAKSGIHWQSLTDDNGFDSALCWRIDRPYPCAIAAVTEMLDTKDQ